VAQTSFSKCTVSAGYQLPWLAGGSCLSHTRAIIKGEHSTNGNSIWQLQVPCATRDKHPNQEKLHCSSILWSKGSCSPALLTSWYHHVPFICITQHQNFVKFFLVKLATDDWSSPLLVRALWLWWGIIHQLSWGDCLWKIWVHMVAWLWWLSRCKHTIWLDSSCDSSACCWGELATEPCSWAHTFIRFLSTYVWPYWVSPKYKAQKQYSIPCSICLSRCFHTLLWQSYLFIFKYVRSSLLLALKLEKPQRLALWIL